MTHPFTPAFESLPDTLPIFPLGGVILLPHAQLPLNIFEPRYLNMVVDALGQGRLIGIAQPDPAKDDKSLTGLGCMGRIVAFNETTDGRFLLNLLGVCRFQLGEEIATTRGYRRFIVDYKDFRADLDDDIDIDPIPLRQAFYNYFEFNNIQVDLEALRQLEGAALVNFLSINLPLEPTEKQQLLTAPSITERAEKLLEIAQAALSNRRRSPQ